MLKFAESLKSLLLLSLFGVALVSCSKDDEPPSEQELITTVEVTLTNQADPTDRVTVAWRDADGPGGANPIIQNLVLKPNTVYSAGLRVLDESIAVDPEDITEEIEEKDTEHQFYYTVSGANLTVTNLNQDRQGLPLGIESVFTTGAASTGTLNIVLKHKPGNKAANDPVSVGATDIDVIFPVSIQ